jgi:Putative polyhydroxyalkanoic acid system protein (PHA_gran_rgn)
MALIQVKVKHGRSHSEARDRLARAVGELQGRFGPMIRTCEWSPSRDSVALTGPGVRLDLVVDAIDVHVSGDIPLLASLLGTDKLRQIVESSFK